MGDTAQLNPNQQRRLRVTCEHLDHLLADIETIVNSAHSRAAFPRYVPDLAPAVGGLLTDSIVAAREQLRRVLAGQGIPAAAADIPASRAVRTTLAFMDIAAEELGPSFMRGYGPLSPESETELRGIVAELKSLVARMDLLVADTGPDWSTRLQRLAEAGRDVSQLRQLELVIAQRGLVELRPALGAILDRLEDERFEIALFGRVSSGKSSLLNAILGADVLPVGVTPVTAVPTRITYGDTPVVDVWRADRPPERHAIGDLAEFIAETRNPGNRLHVTRVLVELPAERLRGISFVDTPGLGSLALQGGAETLAYLPRCDLGVMLVDAASTLTPDDLSLARRLLEAGIPPAVVLSKADLVAPDDRERLAAYIADRLRQEIGAVAGADWSVAPVSSAPGHRQLLDAWFSFHIAPLYAQRQPLRQASLQRKIGALRQAVEAALRGRLRRQASKGGPDAAAAGEAEARLRHAAAAIEPVTQQARERALALAAAAPELLAAAARAFLRVRTTRAADHPVPNTGSDSRFARGGLADPAAAARAAMAEALQRQAMAIASAWRELARQLARDLAAAAETLATGEAGGAELEAGSPGGLVAEFAPSEELLREMPLAELDSTLFTTSLSLPPRWLGQGLATTRLLAQWRRRYEPALASHLDAYAHLLAAWSDRVAARMEADFNAIADPLRAQAGRLNRAPVAADERGAVERDLMALGTPPAN
jgi:GTP-binding protein EngB required for normal cell division